MSKNPYDSPAGEITAQKVAVGPIDCMVRGKELLGEDFWLFLGITVVGMLLAGLGPMGILMGPFFCGIGLCLLDRERRTPSNSGGCSTDLSSSWKA
ncbi:MAG: hypothetical protein QGG36_20125 [Pirellulaceae bacterium]|jgi:hypothetical protein|nr:hypothetical protein [Pirellulaceae bacterium]MDP7018123.1 hypothetical protein [Pirellulaceae bacterium]